MHRLFHLCSLLLCSLLPVIGCSTIPRADFSNPTIATFFTGFEPITSVGIEGAPVASWYGEMPLMGLTLHGVDKADASGIGYLAGLSGMFWRGALGSPGYRWGIRPGIRYVHQHLDAALDRTISTRIATRADDTTTPPFTSAPVRIESTADFEMIQVSAAFIQEFARIGRSGLGLFISPGFSYVMVAKRLETVELADEVQGRFFNPGGLMVADDARKLILYDGDPNLHSSDIRFSLLVGLQLESRIATDLSLISSVEYDFPFWPARGSQENVNSLHACLGLMWNIDWVMILE